MYIICKICFLYSHSSDAILSGSDSDGDVQFIETTYVTPKKSQSLPQGHTVPVVITR